MGLDRPSSAWEQVFPCLTNHKKEKQNRASSGSQYISSLRAERCQMKLRHSMFGLSCDRQTEIRRSKPRGRRGAGALRTCCCSGEAQPFSESCLEDGRLQQLLALDCDFTPETNRTTKREGLAGK